MRGTSRPAVDSTKTIWPSLDEYVWDGSEGRFVRFTADAVARVVASGDLSPFLRFMASDYFDATIWRYTVLPLFRTTVPMDVFKVEPVGTHEEQDALWAWVRDHEGELVFDLGTRVFQRR